jgi:diguanylate cyclase (GGDEF)-like protein
LCDLDGFKEVNDSLGHQVGDQILRFVAESILEATRGSDLAFRWGGDEFLVLLSANDRRGAIIAARRIRQGVQRVGKREGIQLDLSVGVAFYPEHARKVLQLISLADRALYIAKKGGDKIHIGEEEHEVNDDSIRMVYQPIVDVKSGRTIGFEALGRDPAGKVGIGQIFRRYAAVGQLAELKQFIFRQQIRQAEEYKLDKVFVNIDFETLESTKPFPKPKEVEVVLEISEEESLRDIEAHLETTELWREFGFKFAIDDFGAGFMSLPFIARMVPDYIKVDRQTIVEAAGSDQFSDFLRDLVMAMRNYSKDGIIAEGIETASELDAVKKLGVDQVQGFLTGRPEQLKIRID